ncbi:MAG: flagellin [Pirellula sp.]|jgi:flagellin
MTRINTNVSSLNAQNRLNRTNLDLQTSLTRLSTGLRINTGKDDPAGLIASEVLRSDITSINKALSNTQRANQIIGTADSALGQVSSLLNDVRGLVTEAANRGALSDDEVAANQLQIDSSLEAINRIAQTTTFQGRRLLDGSLDFQVSQGANYASVRDLEITSANLGATGSMGVNIEINQAATQALVTADIPAAGASAKAASTFTFAGSTIGAEASGAINLANSVAITTEATGLVNFAAASGKGEASGVLTLDGGAALKISARDGTVVDGTVGNNVKINVTTVTKADDAATATYDADSNTLNLVLLEGATGADVVTALGTTDAADLFTFASGNGTIAAGDAGLKTAVLSGGTDNTLGATFSQASGTAVVIGAGGMKLDINVTAAGLADGLQGNGVKISFTYGTAAAAASYDKASNTLSLTIDTDETVADNVTAFNTALSGNFTVADNSSGAISGTTSGTLTNQLAGGLDPARFRLTAVDGGPADGTTGNTTTLNYTTSATKGTSAVYDIATNKLNITVGQGATIDDIAAAIDTTGAFTVSDVRSGNARFTSAGATPTFSGGNQTTSPGSFKLSAVDGGLADGSVGNATKIKFVSATDGATTAAYDEATNQLTVNVATGAKVQNIVDAINSGAGTVFSIDPTSIVNGNAVFNAADLGTLTAPLSGGTTNPAGTADRLVITANNPGVSANGVKISFVESGSVTAGSPQAALVGGNIQITVSNTGSTKLSAIASAITSLAGGLYSATLSPDSNGEGVYKGALQTPPSTQILAGGITGGGLSDDVTFQLTGGSGSEVFKFQKGATVDSVIQSINLLSDSTGITAAINSSTNKLELRSSQYGSEGIVGVEVLSEGGAGTFRSSLSAPRAVGTDVQATVNGTTATGKGNRITLNTATLSFSLNVTDGASSSIGFTITGGGAQFQLGPDVVSNQQARLGIGSLNTAKIGGVSGKLMELTSSGSSSLKSDVTNASRIVDEVINKVTTLRGRLGAFQRTALDSNTASLNDTLTNLNEAQSSIRDADFAKESAALTRAQILVQSGTSVLGIANQSAQSVLSLLR